MERFDTYDKILKITVEELLLLTPYQVERVQENLIRDLIDEKDNMKIHQMRYVRTFLQLHHTALLNLLPKEKVFPLIYI